EPTMSFAKSQWVWMDGKMVSWDDATVHVSVHALHYGTGVFEGIRAYETSDGPAVFRLPEHMERFAASAAVYNMKVPYSAEQLSDAVCEVIRRNEFGDCYIRPLCHYGSKTLALNPRG